METKKGGKVIKYPRNPRKNRFKLKRPRFLNLVILGFIALAFFLSAGQLLAYWESKQKLEGLRSEKEALQEEKAELEKEVSLLHEEEYIEMKARKHLGMVRQGEIIFFVVD